MAGKVDSRPSGEQLLKGFLDDGQAIAKYQEMVIAQGGDPLIELPLAEETVVPANRAGHLQAVNAELIGQAIIIMGGGRRVMTDPIDHSTGLETLVRIGDPVTSGQPLARLFCHTSIRTQASEMIERAFVISDKPASAPQLIHELSPLH